jgi:signal transduction histidine kinase
METQSALMTSAAAAVLLVAALLRRRDRIALRYAGLTLGFGLWSLGRGCAGLGWLDGFPLEELAAAFTGPLAVALVVELIPPQRRLGSVAPAVALATLGIAVAIAVAGQQYAALRLAGLGWGAAGAVAASALLLRVRPAGGQPDSPDAAWLRYLSSCFVLVIIGIAADLLLGWLRAPRLGTMVAGLLALYVGYLYLLHVRVADLRQMLGNALALLLSASGLAGFFAGLRVWVGPRLDLFVLDAFLASFVLLLLYQPMRDRIQAAMERRFVAGKVALERALLPLGERLPQIFTLDELMRELLATLERTDRVTASAVFLREDPQLGFRSVASIGLPPRPRVNLIRDPAFVAELEPGEPILAEELDAALRETRSKEARERLLKMSRMLRDLDAQLVLPLRAGTHLVGFWTLTDSSSREPFSMTEVKLLRNVAEQAAVSVENSKTFERIRGRDRLVALGEMAGGLAHEIRNPLATIRGALALVTESRADGSDEGSAELEDVILEEVARLDRLVTLFLDYAKPSTRRSTIDDPGDFVRSCVESVARRQPLGAVELEIEIADDLPPISADAEQLETVLANAAQNAYEALDGSGRLRVAVRGDELPASIEISLEDDGPGMDEQTLEHAFVPFFTTKERGGGLGLALCERLVRAQGGTIRLRSKPGEGTTVQIRLPAAGPEAEPSQ